MASECRTKSEERRNRRDYFSSTWPAQHWRLYRPSMKLRPPSTFSLSRHAHRSDFAQKVREETEMLLANPPFPPFSPVQREATPESIQTRQLGDPRFLA